ncbi:MAG: FAD-dependent oxidoreductase [Acuticoccus sp.]
MPNRQFDAFVLGAGMVGIGTALALQDAGRQVALIDRRGPAQETSYGNAGLIQSEAIMPYALPLNLGVILSTLAGRRTDARVALGALWQTAPHLIAYARASRPEVVARTAAANVPLIREAVPAHKALSERAQAMHFWHLSGYLRLFRSNAPMDASFAEAEMIRERYDIPYNTLDADGLREAEPHIASDFVGALHMPTPVRIDDPGGLGEAYEQLFEREGGTFLKGDALGLEKTADGFALDIGGERVTARQAVVCLGPWSGDLLSRFGVRMPLFVKRGYHRHYRPLGNAVLNHCIADDASGYALAPQRRGIRLTTGAEFTRRDDPPSPIQLRRVEPIARTLFPLGEGVEETPWMGARPCLPDLLPAIGPLPGVEGLFANFAHQHHGFTLGPATGRLVAAMMVGETPFANPAPYSPARFSR